MGRNSRDNKLTAELNPGNRQISIILDNIRSGRGAMENVVEKVPPEAPIEEEPPEIEE